MVIIRRRSWYFVKLEKWSPNGVPCEQTGDEICCINKLKEFAQNHKIMPAYIGSAGMFNDTKTVFVSPVMNSSMYQFQRGKRYLTA